MKKNHSRELLLSFYQMMFKIRRFEEEGVKLYRQGYIRGYFHPYWGQEAIAAGVCSALRKDDYITSTHRGHGHCIAWGADLDRMFAELLGKKTGYCKGLGGSMHIADVTSGNLGANGVVASGVPIGVGAALGIRNRDEDKVVAVFLSDGGTNIGSFTEGLNLAATWQLPVIFIIENNQYAASTPIEQSTAETELYKRGIGYGVKSIRVNGNDVVEVYDQTMEFSKACRNRNGPCLIEALTYRKSGHHVNDPGEYMPREKMEYYTKNDPLVIARQYLESMEGFREREIPHIEKEVNHEITEAIKSGQESPEMSRQEFLDFIEGY